MLARQWGSVSAGSGAASDLTALFLGHPTEDADEQGADWANGIKPGLSGADELDTKPIPGAQRASDEGDVVLDQHATS